MQSHSVLDTLVYLFDYLVYEKKEQPTVDEMHEELDAAGFDKQDIDRAIHWLLDLNDLHDGTIIQAPTDKAVRMFTDYEKDKISESGLECLYQLTSMGVISTRLREIIIQKIMTLDENHITADEIKWVALIALYNREDQEANIVWLEQNLIRKYMITSKH